MYDNQLILEESDSAWGLFGTCMITGKLCLLARNIPDDQQLPEIWPNYCGFVIRAILNNPEFEDRRQNYEKN